MITTLQCHHIDNKNVLLQLCLPDMYLGGKHSYGKLKMCECTVISKSYTNEETNPLNEIRVCLGNNQ